MTHISKTDGKTYEIGLIVENDILKSYDIIAIMDFSDLDDIKIVGFYYGDYDYNIAEAYIKKYIE